MKNKGYKMYRGKKIVTFKRSTRITAIALLVCLIGQIVFPTTSWALTSGPQQPEASNFTPADVSNLVDPFTGDFSYNIPMFEIGGYPVNLSYNSGVSMEQEASWTGLGWNLNTGAITRDVRGLPDDFWGDPIKRNFNTKPNITAGGSVTVGFEIAGFEPKVDDGGGSVSYGLQMKYNNYAGLSVGTTLSGGVQFPNNVNVGLGLSTTNGGLDINPNVSYSNKLDKDAKGREYNGSIGFGLNINSRTGLSQMSLNASVNASKELKFYKKVDGNKIALDKQKSGKYSVSGSGGGAISFLNPTFTPQNTLPYQNFNFSGSFKIGGAVSFGDISGTIAGFYSEQSLMTNTITNPSYGYIYSEKGQFVDNATHDFNREKDGAFTNNTPSLPITNYTYDAFNIKAQGIGGSFRPFRNDMGHIFDPEMVNPSAGGSFGAELDLGAVVDFGVDINVNWNESKTGKWKDGNPASNQFKFKEPSYNSLNENVFFKLVGERVSEPDNGYLNRLQKDKAVSISLEQKPIPMTLNTLESNNTNLSNNYTGFSNNNFRQGRMVRNTSVQCFTVAEVKIGFPNYAKFIPDYAPDHHIAMIIVTTPDGTRYVFGLPAYNKLKREVTMAVGQNIDGAVGLTPNSKNQVTYNPTTDATIDNNRGIDNYYDVTETPPYVYTWYLTDVLSPDYSDITGDGPSPDDLGGYVKFDYGTLQPNGKVLANVPNYKWRTPNENGAKANFSKGLRTILTDDKATYLYGEKDIWYPNSIESKTQLVKFNYADRRDGFGAASEHGGIGTLAQKRISTIQIFSKQDYQLNSSSALPLKTIHFEYDYSLCSGVPNNDGSSEVIDGTNINEDKGKLTLKKVYFTYRNSSKAKYSAYNFKYDDPDTPGNPTYDPTANDRWGSYRSNTIHNGAYGIPNNEDYPYTYQDQNSANELCQAWNLQSIGLPTGGKINIEYESDDYAYVQDRKACRMFQVTGSGGESTDNPVGFNRLFRTDNPPDPFEPYEYLFFKLESPIPTTIPVVEANDSVKKLYFDDPNEPESRGPSKFLYFRFLVNVNHGDESPKNEYVGGYADVGAGDYCGVATFGSSSTYEYGWVKLKTTPNDVAGGVPYNPISQAAWSFSRINTPFYANNQAVPGQQEPGDFIKTIANGDIIAQLIAFFQGPNNKLRDGGFGSEFEVGKSYIRLYDPNGRKFGGGHRVKKIEISDEWEQMESNEDSFQYGQEYVYNDAEGKSYGVASYEPMYGADENPFRIPVFYDKEYGPLIPDDRFYQEEPFGESFFPSPSIGYSKVKIMNLQRPNVTKTATGYTVKEFYTAKDFPTITSRTRLNMHRAKIDPITAIFSPYVFDFMTNSQGFVIELNDMHGKPKRESVYQEGNDQSPISKVDHTYKLDLSDSRQIDNNLAVLEKNGDIVSREIGTEVDIVADFRESRSLAGNVDIGFNTDYMQFGPLPLLIFAVFPKVKIEDTDYKSAVVTKVVNRYGVEVLTEAYDLGSVVRTENKLFNGISGEPLSTQVNNEYEDDRFTVSVPAYWAYSGMGHGSLNEGFILRTTSGTNWDRTNGKITFGLPNQDQYFEPGDEFIYYQNYGQRTPINDPTLLTNHVNRVWVAKHSNGDLYFITNTGAPFVTANVDPIDFKLVRSGHRNILNPKISEFATLNAPWNAGMTDLEIDNSHKVLSVTAQTFHEQWKTLKRYDDCDGSSYCVCTTSPYAVQLVNMVTNIINNLAEFENGQLTLYNNETYFNGLTPELLSFFLSQTSCSSVSLSQITKITIQSSFHTAENPWIPGSDIDFLNNNELQQFGIFIYGDNGSTVPPLLCGLCREYRFGLMNVEDVPPAYNQPTPVVESCPASSAYSLYAPVIIHGEPMVLSVNPLSSESEGECGGLRNCQLFTYNGYADNEGDVVNPYVKNILGKWRPYEAYTLIQERKSDFTAVDLRNQGYIDGYSDFWTYASGYWQVNPTLDNVHWKRTTTMTQYHPSGPQIEEQNALGIYSAAIYGYYEQLAIAVAQNASFKEIGFDGFEDYTYLGLENDCQRTEHFKFNEFGTGNSISPTVSHTGKKSVLISNNSSVIMHRKIQPLSSFRTTRAVPYQLEISDLSEFFGPLANTSKRFVFSFWAKQTNYTPVMFDYTGVNGEIIVGSTLTPAEIKKSPIIDGWQKFEYYFDIPSIAAGTDIDIKLNTLSGVSAYFDDVRIHPFNSMMKTYVYDASDLRFMAELDENNYATFYEYDEDGALIRVKKETERGVMTIQENRYGSYKQ